MSSSLKVVAIAAVVVSFAFFCWWWVALREPATVAEVPPERVPDISLLDVDGNNVSLGVIHTEVSIIVSWATWCPYCLTTLTDLERLYVEEGGRVRVVAVNRAEQKPLVQAFIRTHHQYSPIVFLLDDDDKYFTETNGYAMPEVIVLDAKGNVHVHHRGPITYEQLVEHVEVARQLP